jgi:hypothetical protein
MSSHAGPPDAPSLCPGRPGTAGRTAGCRISRAYAAARRPRPQPPPRSPRPPPESAPPPCSAASGLSRWASTVFECQCRPSDPPRPGRHMKILHATARQPAVRGAAPDALSAHRPSSRCVASPRLPPQAAAGAQCWPGGRPQVVWQARSARQGCTAGQAQRHLAVGRCHSSARDLSQRALPRCVRQAVLAQPSLCHFGGCRREVKQVLLAGGLRGCRPGNQKIWRRRISDNWQLTLLKTDQSPQHPAATCAGPSPVSCMELENISATSLTRTCNPEPLAKQGALPTTPRPQISSSRQQPPASDVIDLPRRRPAQLPQACSVEQAPKQALCTRHLHSTGALGRVSSVCLHDREAGRQAAAGAHILKVKVLVVGAVLVRECVRLIHADCRGRSKSPPYKQKTMGALACAGYQGAIRNQTSCGMQTKQMQTGQLQARCKVQSLYHAVQHMQTQDCAGGRAAGTARGVSLTAVPAASDAELRRTTPAEQSLIKCSRRLALDRTSRQAEPPRAGRALFSGSSP